MTVGVWMLPVASAGLVMFLWAAGWFEHLVAPPGGDPELPMLAAVDTGFADTGAGPEFVGTDLPVDAELDRPAA